jgi:hypothetical protein
MTLLQLRKEIKDLKKTLSPIPNIGQVIIYDPEKGVPDQSTLPPASCYIFLPEKDSVPV